MSSVGSILPSRMLAMRSIAMPVRGSPSAFIDRPYWARWITSCNATRLHSGGTCGASSGSGASHSVAARFFGRRGARRSNASASQRAIS